MNRISFSSVKKQIPRHAGAFFIPFAVLCLFKLLSALRIYPAYHDLLSVSSIILCSLAGVSFSLYISCSKQLSVLRPAYRHALCAAYALSSYALINSNSSPSTFAVYILLPVLFLFFEAYIYEEKHVVFLIIPLAAALCFDAVTACILVLYLVLYLILFSPKDFGGRIADLLHFILIFTLSLLVSAAFSFPALKAFFSYVRDIPYPNFSVNYPLANFLSRFFPGTILGIFYQSGRALDLYCGMGFVFLLIGGFFIRRESFATKLKKLLYALFVIGTLELTPLQHLIELCSDTDAADIYYGFFACFLLLKAVAEFLCTDSDCRQRNDKLPVKACAALLAVIIMTGIGILGTCYQLPAISTGTILCFSVLYIALFLLHPFLHSNYNKLYPVLFSAIIILELACNLFINANSTLISDKLQAADRYPWQKEDQTEAAKSAYYTDEYEEYYRTHTANQLYEAIHIVNDTVDLTEEEITAYNPYGSLSVFEEFHLKTQKLGIPDSLLTPVDCHFTFLPSELYDIYDTGNRIRNLSYYAGAKNHAYVIVPFSCELPDSNNSSRIILYNNFSNDLYELQDPEETGYLSFYYTGAFNINFIIEAYQLNDSVLDQIAPALEVYVSEKSHRTAERILSLLPFLCSCIGLLLLLFLTVNPDKEEFAGKLRQKKEHLARAKFLAKIRAHFAEYRIYYAAFLIPFCIYLTAMIVYSSEPFGSKTFLDQDGYPSVLAGILQAVYPYREGNFWLTYNGGFYMGVFPGFYSLYHMLLALFPVHAIAGILILTEGILIGLCGYSVCFYLTHRYIADRADRQDIRLLIPALIYSLNTYMIAMHSYAYSWYLLFFLLPLLVLAMERMLYEKKWLPYLLILAVCIGTNINITLYICIYLALHFFMCRFENPLDFLKKGLLFGASSLLGALCSFVNILGVSSGRESMGYAATDNIRPVPGFYMSFAEQWKKFMFLTDFVTISENRGDLNLYMGCLTLVLCLAFFFFCKRKRLDKIRLFLCILLLLFSFNGRILSYLWNGMHYPAGVPNRFVFLLMFICALLSYDALLVLKKLSVRRVGICFGLVICFVILMQIISSGNTAVAFIFTLILLAGYFVIHIMSTKKEGVAKLYYPVMIGLFTLEIAVNTWYSCGKIYLSDNEMYGNFEALAESNQKVMNVDPSFSRFTFPATHGENFGFFRNSPTLSIFTSYLDQRMQTANNNYGFNSGANFIISNSDATPFGLSLSNTEFIQVPMISSLRLRDLDRYEYIGFFEGHYTFRNPDVLGLGLFVPDVDELMPDEGIIHPIDFANDLAALYLSDPDKSLLQQVELSLTEEPGIDNSYCYLNEELKPVSEKEAVDILVADGTTPNPIFASKKVYLSVTATPQLSGYYYLYAKEFVSLGYHKEGEPFTVTLEYPNKIFADEMEFEFCVMDEDVYREFIDRAASNQLEQVKVFQNKITACLDYDEAGYTMMSLPYGGAWDISINGQPAETAELYHCFLGIKTPAGKHKLEMVYDFSESIAYNIKILCLLLLIIAAAAAERFIRRKKK